MSVEYEVRGHMAIITLNRPEARNAINGIMATGIEHALDRFEDDPELWVAILTANGKAFCAGADLKEISAGNGGKLGTEKGGFAGIVKRERTKPLIAAITGSALAGGTEIALSCDMIICADTTNFGLPEVKRSLVAGAGGLFRLPRVIGMPTALEAILTGDPLPAQREADVMAEASKLAERIMANAPIAVQASRQVAHAALTSSDDDLWIASGKAFGKVMKTEDFKEGPRAFIEKRAPVWKGK